MDDLEFRVLGPTEIRVGGAARRLVRTKQRALLAMLLLHANRVVSIEALIDGLWGEAPPASARKLVQIYVGQLRRLLEPADVLHTRSPGYLLTVDPDQVDVVRFERLGVEGRLALEQDEPEVAAETLRQALDLWRGPALADVATHPFVTTESARLEELRLALLEERIEADLALGRHANLVGELETLVAAHPYRERLRGQLMLALYRSRRQVEALGAYRDLRRLLVNELGVEPSPALRRLQKQVLAQDPALDTEWMPPSALPPTVRTSEPAPVEEVRKTVTVLVCDLVGELDSEAAGHETLRFIEEVTRVLEGYGGTVLSLVGDAVTAVYGHPTLREDDALRAVRAADEVRERLAELGRSTERRVGIGIETGEVLARPVTQHRAIAGAVVKAAARLQRGAGPGQILLGEATWRLVRDAVRAEPASTTDGNRPAWLLLQVLPRPRGLAVRSETPFVGREPELEQLRAALDRAMRTRSASLCTVFGEAGLGKTRLAREFAMAVAAEARIVVGRALPYREGAGLTPFTEIVHGLVAGPNLHAGLCELLADDVDAELVATRIAAAIGAADVAGDVEDIWWAARRLISACARDRPLVLVFEDVQWAAPEMLELVEQLAGLAQDAAVVVLCLARPELLDVRPGWAAASASSVLLAPLSVAEADRLIEYRLEGAPLEVGARSRIRDAAEGNPLFLEQMLALALEADSSTGELEVPESIHALLAARLNRLSPQELAVIERGALVGREFSASAVAYLLPTEVRPSAARHLRSLVRKELLLPVAASLRAEELFRFSHGLIREAAYRAVPKHIRAELHEGLADWLEREAVTPLAGSDELVAHHLEQSYRYRAELGAIDEHLVDIGTRAAARLAAAGRKAHARGELRSSADFFDRAASLLQTEATERTDILLELFLLHLVLASTPTDVHRAQAFLAEVAEASRRTGDLRAQWRVAVDRLLFGFFVDDWTGARTTAEQAIHVFAESGEERGLARAWRVLAGVLSRAGDMAGAQEAHERALEHAVRSGDEREQDAALLTLSEVLRTGPAPVEELAAVCRRRIDWARARGMRAREVGALNLLAWAEAAQGRIDPARELFDRERAYLAELGLGEHDQPLTRRRSLWARGHVEMLAGNVEEAERCYRRVYELLDRRGRGWPFASAAVDLAHALCALGRYDEAGQLVEICEAEARLPDGDQLGDTDDIFLAFTLEAARAKVLAGRGELDAATTSAQRGVELAGRTDYLQGHADRLMDLAEVLELSHRTEQAVGAVESAIALYERKGIVPAAAVARERLEELHVPESFPRGLPA